MRWITLGAISSLTLFLGCVGIPKKPQVELCQLDAPAGTAICGLTDASDPAYRVPIADMDKATTFRPAEWEKIQVYIHLMEDYVRNQCRK